MANAINSLNFGNNTYTFTLPYGSCSTAAGTAAKTVDVDNFSLETGARVLVKFTVTNTAASPTLNVEGTGAKAIYYNGAAITAGYLKANKTYEFVYNGTQWDMISDVDTNTTYTFNGAVSTIKDSNLTASRALVSNSSGKIATSDVTSTELGYLDGVTSAIQTQLDGKAASSHNHSASQITSGTISTERLPAASGTQAGITLVYPAASCTTFSSDSGTVTPAAVQKGAKMFAITRPSSSTNKAIVRYSNTTGDVQDSKITIEDVTNTKDTSKKANVLAIPAEGGKKMVYGYCTDQVDGTSFIGGVFDASATSYPYAQGLAIGGTSGNLLWKGVKVATTNDIPTSLKNPYSLTIQGNGTTLTNGTYDGSAAKTVNITPASIGAAASSHNHAASNITSGTLGVARGGTGNSNGYIQIGALSGTTVGTLATAEGRNVTASGSYCHAEGNYTEASGSSAHAEGQSSTASGIASHAEGNNATASGNYSHAEGDFTSASAKGAHAEGTYTLASSEYQHVQGKFNVEDKAGTYAHIVGNGESTSARSNAHTLDWDGNAWFAGDVYVGGTGQEEGARLVKSDTIPSLDYGSAEPSGTPEGGEGSVYFRTGGDAVVEIGTEGIWTYKKWASGIAECWGTLSTTVTAWDAWGGMYEQTTATAAVNYPTGLFNAAPQIYPSASGSAGNAGVELYGTNSATKTPSFFVLRGSTMSSSSTFDIYVHCIGRWK